VIPQPVLFIQGAGDMRHPEGSGVLADYLDQQLGTGYRVVAPAMPDADNPRYLPWRGAIEQELAAIAGSVMLVGHSFGGSVLLKHLAEGSSARPTIGLFLISVPFWGPEGWEYEEFSLPSDFGAKLPRCPIFLYHSQDDPEVPFAHLGLYARRLPNPTARRIAGSEHSFLHGLPELVRDIRATS
jgi:predicted alpha/beta hydrolase family esterase